jgi:hypothetical protein
MVILFRYILITLIVILLIRSFARYGRSNEKVKGRDSDKQGERDSNGRKISQEVGEYIDYEEVDD